MRYYNTVKKLPYTSKQMYNLVNDIELYPDFLPWCNKLEILERNKLHTIAKMSIDFQGVSKSFISKVFSDEKNNMILVKYEEGPFKNLDNKWYFKQNSDDSCEIHFDISFAFKNKIIDLLLHPLFSKIVCKMVSAFEDRAKYIYVK